MVLDVVDEDEEEDKDEEEDSQDTQPIPMPLDLDKADNDDDEQGDVIDVTGATSNQGKVTAASEPGTSADRQSSTAPSSPTPKSSQGTRIVMPGRPKASDLGLASTTSAGLLSTPQKKNSGAKSAIPSGAASQSSSGKKRKATPSPAAKRKLLKGQTSISSFFSANKPGCE